MDAIELLLDDLIDWNTVYANRRCRRSILQRLAVLTHASARIGLVIVHV